MIDDSKFGIRNKRGDWKPFVLSESAPIFQWPLKVSKIFKWLLFFPGYIFHDFLGG